MTRQESTIEKIKAVAKESGYVRQSAVDSACQFISAIPFELLSILDYCKVDALEWDGDIQLLFNNGKYEIDVRNIKMNGYCDNPSLDESHIDLFTKFRNKQEIDIYY